MQHTAQLTTYSHAGIPATPPFSFNITGAAAWKKARALGRVSSLIRTRDEEGDDAAPAIGLAYVLTFPQSYNIKAAWTVSSGGAYWEEGARPFRGNITALGYTNNNVNTNASFTTRSTGLVIPENEGFAIRARLAKPPRGQALPNWYCSWANWRFEIAAGKPVIMRRSAAWTQAQENALTALLILPTPTSSQQASLDALRAAIYEDYQELNLGAGDDYWYANPFTLAFIPEERGLLTVQLEGSGSATVRIESIIETRASGTVWASSPLTVGINGGFFYWQVGYPQYAPTGTVELLRYKTGYWSNALEPMVFSALQSTPANTSITLEDLAIDSIWSTIRATFATTDTRTTPRLYAASALIPAGLRTWQLEDATWDSVAKETDLGRKILTDVEISYEGDMRRAQVQATIADPFGRVFLGMGDNYATLEHRMGSFAIDGVPIVGKGLVKEATYNDMLGALPNQARLEVVGAGGSATVTLCDAWALLEEDIMRDVPVGDGLTLGAYIRLILRNFGYGVLDYAGVPPDEGRVLPRAALGETAAIKPDGNSTRAEYLRSLVDKWGMGRILWISASGVWNFGYRSTTIVAEFRKLTDNPGRYRIATPLDSVRDPADFYNYFRVIGSKPELDLDWNIIESQIAPSGPTPTTYLGRIKPYPTVNDDGIRTLDDVNFVLRSLVRQYGKPGRYWEFGTYFIPGLFPGDRITVDGVLCEICRISSASVDDDSMKLSVREII